MKIVLGVDAEGRYADASRLLSRLDFAGSEVDALHVMTPVVFYPADPMGMTLMTGGVFEQIQQASEANGRRLADAAADVLRGDGLTVAGTRAEFGSPAERLMEHADRVGADLVAVGSGRKGALRAFFTGSVGRGLMIGAHQSLLIAKGGPRKAGPVRAVLATDHSPYADACLGRLLRLAPRGISHLTVVSVFPKEFIEDLRPYLPKFALDPAEWIEQGLCERNRQAAERLSPLGCGQITSRVMTGDVDAALARAVAEAGADLLILGAQGHGFAERLRLGSTSFHQAVAEPYPVLVLRLPQGTVAAAPAA